jgi:type IV secretion system protein VirD4
VSRPLLARMTDPGASVFDADFDTEAQTTGGLRVTGPRLPAAFSEFGASAARLGGGYVLASGAGAVICLAARVPADLDLLVVGACLSHGAMRVTEGLAWHRKGGRAAQRRRDKYQGEAGPFEIRTSLSPAAAVKKMARLAPSLPAAQAAVRIGATVSKPAQQVAVSRAETILVTGVPQSIKTAWISTAVLEAPGAVLATSSRGDQWQHTAAVRQRLGEVHVLDADGYGPGTTLAWNPVTGCRDPRTAIRRAGDFMQASPRDPGGKDAWHEARGGKLLRWALHAADLAGKDVQDARRWVDDPEHELFMKALRSEKAAYGWADGLESMLVQGPELMASAVTSAQAALDWLDDPEMAAVACPRGGGLDIASFLRRGTGTVYLIGSERHQGALTPFFSAFASEFLEQARILAENSPGRRLQVPLTIAADEAATTARFDFKRWCAVTAGYNITVIAGLQALSQLSAWGGAEDQETIMTLFSTKIFAGGMTSQAELERVSFVIGEHDTWHREHGAKVRSRERVFPPERVRMLPDMNALVLQRNRKPVQVKITPVWNHRLHTETIIVPAPEVPEEAEETQIAS